MKPAFDYIMGMVVCTFGIAMALAFDYPYVTPVFGFLWGFNLGSLAESKRREAKRRP